MRLILYIFLIICWTFLVLAPLNALAENITFTCKPVVAGMPKKLVLVVPPHGLEPRTY